MCHELGHNLGMNHDFVDPFTYPKAILRDSKGNSCTDVNGVMDYGGNPSQWTSCSVEYFTQHYNNMVTANGKFCLEVNGGTAQGNNGITWPPSFGISEISCILGDQLSL